MEDERQHLQRPAARRRRRRASSSRCMLQGVTAIPGRCDACLRQLQVLGRPAHRPEHRAGGGLGRPSRDLEAPLPAAIRVAHLSSLTMTCSSAKIDLDRRCEVVARPAQPVGELGLGEGALRVLARVERRDRDPVDGRSVTVEDRGSRSPRSPGSRRAMSTCSPVQRARNSSRVSSGRLRDEADPPDHDASADSCCAAAYLRATSSMCSVRARAATGDVGHREGARRSAGAARASAAPSPAANRRRTRPCGSRRRGPR